MDRNCGSGITSFSHSNPATLKGNVSGRVQIKVLSPITTSVIVYSFETAPKTRVKLWGQKGVYGEQYFVFYSFSWSISENEQPI